jgi:hypothetical protein
MLRGKFLTHAPRYKPPHKLESWKKLENKLHFQKFLSGTSLAKSAARLILRGVAILEIVWPIFLYTRYCIGKIREKAGKPHSCAREQILDKLDKICYNKNEIVFYNIK